jgi:hypothetical protein
VARTAAHFVDNSLEAQAGRLYNASFGRAPDESGLDYWSATLHDGVPLDGIAGLFLTSAEFQARYGSPGTTSFVNALYQNVLARGADTGGLTYWRGQLDGGALTRAQVLASFSESAENKAATPASANAEAAARLYYATLDRAPDADGLAFWTSQLSAGTATLTQEADSLAGSAEFVATYSNLGDVAFVRVLYQNVLGRAADAGGIASWSNALAAGASRGSVVTGFSESGEMKARFAAVIGQDGIVVA